MADGAGATRKTRMSADQFLAWCLEPDQADARYELVDGWPVEAMAGASDNHDQIVVNVISALKLKLKGSRCVPRTADQAVKTQTDQRERVRRPDVIVDCGPRNPRSLISKTPTVVFEVLSPSTENIDRSAKRAEYCALDTMRHVVLIDQDSAFVTLYSRAANDAWTETELEGLEAVCVLDAIGVTLSLADIYDDVAFSTGAEDEN